MAFLPSGGGEFAFVVLALAEKLEVLPKDLDGLLTAIVLITMAVTALLGQAAAVALKALASRSGGGGSGEAASGSSDGGSQVAGDAVVICGYGEVGRKIVKNLGGTRNGDPGRDGSAGAGGAAYELPQVVAFNTEPSLINSILMPGSDAVVVYGDGENPEVL